MALPKCLTDDHILKWLLIGTLGPLSLFILLLGLAFLGISLLSYTGQLFNYLFYIFAVSFVCLLVYIPFFKKTKDSKNKEEKIFIFLWLLVSLVILIVWAKASSFQLSMDFGVLTFALIPTGLVLLVVGTPFFVIHLVIKRISSQRAQIVAYSTISAVVASLITAGLVFLLKPPYVELSYPYPMKTDTRTSFACKGLIYSTVYAQNNFQKKAVMGDLKTKESDLDKLAIQINGDKLEFTTEVNIKVGIPTGEPIPIVENSAKRLVAIDLAGSGLSQPKDIFILNKENGIALWTETTSFGLLTGDPSVFSEYFQCL